MSEQNQAGQPAQNLQVTTSALLADLKSGLDRKAIARKYGVSQSVVAEWFKAPSLRNKRVRPASNYVLIDDIDDAPKKVSAPKQAAPVAVDGAAPSTVIEQPSAQTAEVAAAPIEEEGDVNGAEAIASAEAPLPTGQISEVSSADDSAKAADEVADGSTASKGLW